MDFESFSDYFWAYQNDSLVTYTDRAVNNKDFCDSICFDAYRVYEQSGMDIDIICKMAENMLFNVHRFKPILGSK